MSDQRRTIERGLPFSRDCQPRHVQCLDGFVCVAVYALTVNQNKLLNPTSFESSVGPAVVAARTRMS